MWLKQVKKAVQKGEAMDLLCGNFVSAKQQDRARYDCMKIKVVG